MINLALSGILSQSNEAKILADAYCAFVIAQGAVVDYDTIYNIYKNEYLTDPDKDKLAIWFDARAGKIPYGITYPTSYKGLYSLVYPYIGATSGVTPWRIVDNKMLKTTASMPALTYNMYILFQNIKNLKTVIKLDWLPSLSAGVNPLSYYYGTDNIPSNSVSHYLRYYPTGGVKPRSYLTHFELTNASIITTHSLTPNDLYGIINIQEINYVDKIHRNTFNGEMRQLAINAANTHKIIEPTTTAFMYIYDHTPRYYEKVYKM